METKIYLEVTLEVPEDQRNRLEDFRDQLFSMAQAKLFSLFAVRNVVRKDK